MILALVFSGLFLIYLDFFLPGTIMAFVGGMLLLASLALFWFQFADPFWTFLFLCGILIALYFAIRAALAHLKKRKGLICEDVQEGFQACIYPKELMGRSGVVVTDLKPSGKIRVEKKVFGALSLSGYLNKGSRIRVIGGQGSHLLVVEEGDPKI